MKPSLHGVHAAGVHAAGRSWAPRLLRAGALGLLLAVPVAGAQQEPAGFQAAPGSPAQLIFDRVNTLLQNEYGGLSTVDRTALRAEYQVRLNAVCSTDPQCPESKAYPVLEAELTALKDEHSYFMTPEDLSEFITRATGGNRNQFGVRLARLDGENRVVTEVVPGSVAQEAGLQRGDVLVRLNDRPYTYAALRRARETNENITLTVQRLGQEFTVSMTARESSSRELPSLRFVNPDGSALTSGADGRDQVAVIRIPTFLAGGGIAQAVHNQVGQAQARGAKGLIVDLRGNTGGSLVECDNAVSAFVPSLTRVARSAAGNAQTVVTRGTRQEDGRLMGGVRQPNLWTGPLVVLVDQGSASCSEFFAYEVQYAKRGPVIGEQTAGVGNTATRVFQAGGGALQLTILNYAKPDGVPYPVQVMPDVLRTQGEEQIRMLTQGMDDLLNTGLSALLTAPPLTMNPFRQVP